MQEIYIENIRKIIPNRKKLEKEIGIKITNKGKNVFVDGPAEKEFLGIEILEAINMGFSIEEALILKDDGITLQKVHIKDITKRHDLERVRARIIGTHGKTLNTLKKLTGCNISLHNNHIGIIGDVEDMEDAIQAITSIIQGSKQGNVYARLEGERKKRKLRSRDIDLVDKLK